jgi:putative flippase GtrA
MTARTRWLRFAAVSAAGFLLQLAVVAALAAWRHAPAAAATTAGVSAAILHNFFWHARWTWADRRAARPSRPGRTFARFALANGAVSLLGNVAIASLLVGVAAVDVVLANVIAVAACGLVNYWAADRLAFQRT